MSKTFLFPAIQFSQTVLIQTIQFSISVEMVITQLNVETVLFPRIQLSVSKLSMSKRFYLSNSVSREYEV